jgi:hypothetical protein
MRQIHYLDYTTLPDLFVSGFAHLIPGLAKKLKEKGITQQDQTHTAVSSARTGYVGKFMGFLSKKAKKQCFVSVASCKKKLITLSYTLQ